MNENEILFSSHTVPDEALYRSMIRAIHRRNWSYTIYGVVFTVIFGILAFCQLYGNLFMPEEPDNWFVFGLFALGTVVMYVLCFEGYKLRAKQMAKQRPEPERYATTLRFSSKEAELETNSTVTTFPLEALVFAGEDDTAFFFMDQNELFAMAKKGFTIGTPDDFSRFANANLPKKAKKQKKDKKK